MELHKAVATMLTRAGTVAVRPDGKAIRLNPATRVMDATKPYERPLPFLATDVLADDWEIVTVAQLTELLAQAQTAQPNG